jgi:hypothetical protein
MIISFSVNVTFANETQKDVLVPAALADARLCTLTLFDENNAVALLGMQAISASTIRVTSEIPLTADYTLNITGESAVVPPAPAPVSPSEIPPGIENLKTYAEAREKLLADLDMRDETFVEPNELIGYFNEGIDEAESEILKIDEDYFLTSTPLPVVEGQASYAYPANIFGFKVRGIVYENGTLVYDVRKFRRRNKFENIHYARTYSDNDYVRWYHTNDAAGRGRINFVPPPKETAIIPPSANPFTPFTLWYLRHANRIPLLGQYVINWEQILQSTAVDPGLDQIVANAEYVTGDKVKLYATGSMPGGLTQGAVYYVIKGTGYIKLATTLQNARTGTAIDITAAGTGVLSVSIAATQTIVDNTLLDIPEFLKFVWQWAKCRCLEKEGDPRLGGAAATLTQQRQQMVDTLTEIQPDDQNEVEADFSQYTEMS